MNIKRINARANLNHSEVISNIMENKTMSNERIIIYLCKEILTLQKYIYQLLLDRLEKKMKIGELLND